MRNDHSIHWTWLPSAEYVVSFSFSEFVTGLLAASCVGYYYRGSCVCHRVCLYSKASSILFFLEVKQPVAMDYD